MKVLAVKANNRKRQFEVLVGSTLLAFPYSKAEPRPGPEDLVRGAAVDPELGREGFAFELRSGRAGTVHVEQVLEYDEDPGYLRDQLLYQLRCRSPAAGCRQRTVQARAGAPTRDLSGAAVPPARPDELRQVHRSPAPPPARTRLRRAAARADEDDPAPDTGSDAPDRPVDEREAEAPTPAAWEGSTASETLRLGGGRRRRLARRDRDVERRHRAEAERASGLSKSAALPTTSTASLSLWTYCLRHAEHVVRRHLLDRRPGSAPGSRAGSRRRRRTPSACRIFSFESNRKMKEFRIESLAGGSSSAVGGAFCRTSISSSSASMPAAVRLALRAERRP